MILFRALFGCVVSLVLMTNAVMGATMKINENHIGFWITICAGGESIQVPVGLNGEPIEVPVEHTGTQCQCCTAHDLIVKAAYQPQPAISSVFILSASIALPLQLSNLNKVAHLPRAPPSVV